jgi:hypothetical protein
MIVYQDLILRNEDNYYSNHKMMSEMNIEQVNEVAHHDKILLSIFK